MKPDTAKRKCGPCTLCCTLMEIKRQPEDGEISFHKPGYQHCQHECAKGCAIYPKRPHGCRVFECLWLQGWGDKRDRPDRLGAVPLPANDPTGPRALRALGLPEDGTYLSIGFFCPTDELSKRLKRHIELALQNGLIAMIKHPSMAYAVGPNGRRVMLEPAGPIRPAVARALNEDQDEKSS